MSWLSCCLTGRTWTDPGAGGGAEACLAPLGAALAGSWLGGALGTGGLDGAGGGTGTDRVAGSPCGGVCTMRGASEIAGFPAAGRGGAPGRNGFAGSAETRTPASAPVSAGFIRVGASSSSSKGSTSSSSSEPRCSEVGMRGGAGMPPWAARATCWSAAAGGRTVGARGMTPSTAPTTPARASAISRALWKRFCASRAQAFANHASKPAGAPG